MVHGMIHHSGKMMGHRKVVKLVFATCVVCVVVRKRHVLAVPTVSLKLSFVVKMIVGVVKSLLTLFSAISFLVLTSKEPIQNQLLLFNKRLKVARLF